MSVPGSEAVSAATLAVMMGLAPLAPSAEAGQNRAALAVSATVTANAKLRTHYQAPNSRFQRPISRTVMSKSPPHSAFLLPPTVVPAISWTFIPSATFLTRSMLGDWLWRDTSGVKGERLFSEVRYCQTGHMN